MPEEPLKFLNGLVTAAKSLSRETAYLLLFLIVLALIGSLTIVRDVLPRAEDPLPLISLIGFIFITVLTTTLLVIRMRSAQRPDSAVASAPVTFSSTGHKAVDEDLLGINTALIEAMQKDNKSFRQLITEQCHIFRSRVADWRNGRFRAEGDAYGTVLLTLYRNATDQVFSTCVKEYMSTWTDLVDGLGEKILAAHVHSGRPVTRVFIFRNIADVDEADIEVMRKQDSLAKPDITVRVYLKDSNRDYQLPPPVQRGDFTIIDEGEAIGITDGFHPLSALWFFQDANVQPLWLAVQGNLEERSERFDIFHAKWKTEQAKLRVSKGGMSEGL